MRKHCVLQKYVSSVSRCITTGVLPHHEQAILSMQRYHLYSRRTESGLMPLSMNTSGTSSQPSTGWSDMSRSR